MLVAFKKNNNDEQINFLAEVLKKTAALGPEDVLTRTEMTDVLSIALQRVSQYHPRMPEREFLHASIVKECSRLLSSDELWHNVFKNEAKYLKIFNLDALFGQEDPAAKKVAESMGSLLMIKVPNIDLSDIVDEDYSMEKISQSLLRLLMTSSVR